MTLLAWGDDGAPHCTECPACGDAQPKTLLVIADGHPMLRCAVCASAFEPERHEAVYTSMPPGPYLQFYLEQNADLLAMARLLARADDGNIGSVLDVGCGFGFLADMASRALGWRACGVDPSPLTHEGRRLLGADLRPAYLSDALPLGAPFDLLIASEVIEHVDDPSRFIALLCRRLACDGILALTTPNAEVLSAAMPSGEALAILAPGSHLVIFSPSGLRACLRRAGFAHVQVRADGNTLTALASARTLGAEISSAALAEPIAARYCRVLLDRTEPATPLWNGAAGRLLQIEASHGAALSALALFDRIACAWRRRYGWDLSEPATIPVQALGDGGLDGMHTAYPFNLGPVLLSHAHIAAAIGDTARAIISGGACLRIGLEVQRRFAHAAWYDAELQHTVWSARALLVDVAAGLVPDLAADFVGTLAKPSAGTAQVADPPRTVLVARYAERFIRLVHAGNYREAGHMECLFDDPDAIAAALADRASDRLHLLYCLAILRLNGWRDEAGARAAFRRVVDAAEACLRHPATAALGAEFSDLARRQLSVPAEVTA